MGFKYDMLGFVWFKVRVGAITLFGVCLCVCIDLPCYLEQDLAEL
jgi:hypothetical protein